MIQLEQLISRELSTKIDLKSPDSWIDRDNTIHYLLEEMFLATSTKVIFFGSLEHIFHKQDYNLIQLLLQRCIRVL